MLRVRRIGAASELVGLQAPLAAGALLGLAACLALWRRRQSIARGLQGVPQPSADD